MEHDPGDRRRGYSASFHEWYGGRPGGGDDDRDGVVEGCQHNTMDVEYYGPNPQMGTWYLGALREMEELARHQGEHDFAAECRRLFDSGSAWLDAQHFENRRNFPPEELDTS